MMVSLTPTPTHSIPSTVGQGGDRVLREKSALADLRSTPICSKTMFWASWENSGLLIPFQMRVPVLTLTSSS